MAGTGTNPWFLGVWTNFCMIQGKGKKVKRMVKIAIYLPSWPVDPLNATDRCSNAATNANNFIFTSKSKQLTMHDVHI